MSDRVDKLETAVKKIAGDVGEVRTEQRGQRKELTNISGQIEDLSGQLGDVAVAVKEIQRTQTALANAMTAAMKQLAVDKTLELRMQRLEDAVFGSKH